MLRSPFTCAEPVPLDSVSSECKRECEEMVVPRTAGMEISGFEHRPDTRRGSLQVSLAAAEHKRFPGRGLDEVEQHPQRRRLAGTVRAEKSCDRSASEF